MERVSLHRDLKGKVFQIVNAEIDPHYWLIPTNQHITGGCDLADYNFQRTKHLHQRAPCYDVASVRKRDGAKRHDTFYSNAGHVPEGPCVTRLLCDVTAPKHEKCTPIFNIRRPFLQRAARTADRCRSSTASTKLPIDLNTFQIRLRLRQLSSGALLCFQKAKCTVSSAWPNLQ